MTATFREVQIVANRSSPGRRSVGCHKSPMCKILEFRKKIGWANINGLDCAEMTFRSGSTQSNRPQLKKLLHQLGEGDVVVVTRLDRLMQFERDKIKHMQKIWHAGLAMKGRLDLVVPFNTKLEGCG